MVNDIEFPKTDFLFLLLQDKNILKYRGPILRVTWPASGSDDLNFRAICAVSAQVTWHGFFL